MVPEELDGDVIAAIKFATLQKWELTFKQLKQSYEQQISGTADADLIKLKAKVNIINEIEQLFLGAHHMTSR